LLIVHFKHIKKYNYIQAIIFPKNTLIFLVGKLLTFYGIFGIFLIVKTTWGAHSMRYVLDHDLHIHSGLSTCSNDPEQNPERILAYAKERGFKTICLTDHFWDSDVPCHSTWYARQNYEHLCKAKPLPQDKIVEFLFGCETELNSEFELAITLEHFDNFDFVIIPTTHMHMKRHVVKEEDFESVERRSQLWIDRFDAVLNMDLPFHKIGIAHLTCEYLGFPSFENFITALQMIPDSEMERLFLKAAELGVGIELNGDDLARAVNDPLIQLRPYRIAKQCGCKFYFGSDAHHPAGLTRNLDAMEKTIDLLRLEESDKFHIGR